MSDSDKNIHDLAANYFDLWQKQLKSKANEQLMEDSLKTMQTFQEEAGAMMKNMDSPDKIQNWMETWTNAWKAQLSETETPFAQTPADWSKTAGAAFGNFVPNMDELSKRVSALEDKVAELELRLKEKG